MPFESRGDAVTLHYIGKTGHHMGLMNLIRDAVGYDRLQSVMVEPALAELRRRTKIVIVDDDEDSFPTSALQDDGYTIEAWTSLDAARLGRLESAAFDLIILDIKGVVPEGMSDTGDALGVLRRIKLTSPRQLVVAFSGQQYDLDAVPFWKMADDSLTKPVTIVQCKELLDDLIQSKLTAEAQWRSMEESLRIAGKSKWRIRRLEGSLVRSIKSGREPDRLTVAGILGAVDSLDTILSWSQRIFWLCSVI